jgi:ribosome-associated protein
MSTWADRTGCCYGVPVDPDPPISGLRLAPGLILPEALLTYTFVASGGPGGQNVNKRATKCQLRVRLSDLPLTHAQLGRLIRLAGAAATDAGDLVIVSSEHRSQGQNKAECEHRLADLVRRALVTPKVRRATKPSRGSKERRLQDKKSRSEIKSRRRGVD